MRGPNVAQNPNIEETLVHDLVDLPLQNLAQIPAARLPSGPRDADLRPRKDAMPKYP